MLVFSLINHNRDQFSAPHPSVAATSVDTQTDLWSQGTLKKKKAFTTKIRTKIAHLFIQFYFFSPPSFPEAPSISSHLVARTMSEAKGKVVTGNWLAVWTCLAWTTKVATRS